MTERILDVDGHPVRAVFDTTPTAEEVAFVTDFLRAAVASGAPLAPHPGNTRHLGV